MMFNPDYFILSFLIAVFAFVYTNILTANGEVFGCIYKMLYHKFKSDQREQNGLPRHPLFKVLIDCEKCVSGQISLWSFLILHLYGYREVSFALVLQHILFITLTILFTIIIKSFYIKLLE